MREIKELKEIKGWGMEGERDFRKEKRKLMKMNEEVLKDGIGNVRGEFGEGNKENEMRMKIGREEGEGIGGDIERMDEVKVEKKEKEDIGIVDLREWMEKSLKKKGKMDLMRKLKKKIEEGNWKGNGIGERIDKVRDDEKEREGKIGEELKMDSDDEREDDIRKNGVEKVGEVWKLRLEWGILNDGLEIGKSWRNKNEMSGEERKIGEFIEREEKEVNGIGFGIKVLNVDLREEWKKGIKKKVKGKCEDGEEEGKRKIGIKNEGEKRKDKKEDGENNGKEIIRRGSVKDIEGGEMDSEGIGEVMVLEK